MPSNDAVESTELSKEQIEGLLASSAKEDDLRAVCDFGKLVFGVEFAEHHKSWIQEILNNKRVVLVAPPESAKTTVMIVLVAWWIGKRPWTTNLICSAGENLAQAIAKRIADTIEFNPKWKLVFPNVEPYKERGWSRDGYEVVDRKRKDWAMLVATKKDPTLAAGGVGSSSVNGRRVTGIGVGDDLHDRESKSSDTICKQVVDFVKDTFLPRHMESAHCVIVQTRWNPADIVGYLDSVSIRGERMYEVKVHKALLDNGDSYWPAQWPLERIERRRSEIGEIDFQLVYLANAHASKGNILKSDYLIPFPAVHIRTNYDCYVGVDFAVTQESMVGTRHREGDNFAMARLVDCKPVLVVEDGFVGRISQGEAEDSLIRFCCEWMPKRVLLETNAAGELFYQQLLRRMRETGLNIPLLGRKATKGKAVRINEMLPDFQYGRIKVSDANTRFMNAFRNEWISFGSKGVHDDTLDAVYWSWRAAGHLLTEHTNEYVLRDNQKLRPPQHAMRSIEGAYFEGNKDNGYRRPNRP